MPESVSKPGSKSGIGAFGVPGVTRLTTKGQSARIYSWASVMLSNDSHLMVELVVQAFERENPLMLYPGQVLVVNRAYIGEIKLVGPIGGSFSPYEGVIVAWVPYNPDLVGQAPPVEHGRHCALHRPAAEQRGSPGRREPAGRGVCGEDTAESWPKRFLHHQI